MKICKRCNTPKSFMEFRPNSRGVLGRHTYCDLCQREYDRQRYIDKKELRVEQIKRNRDRVTAAIRALKEGKPCTDCGQSFHFAAMEFDHLPQFEKLASVSDLARAGQLKKALAEIAKCELVCANCHAVRTYSRL